MCKGASDGEEDCVFAMIKVTTDYKNILMFIENLKQELGLDNDYDIQCGYETGCLVSLFYTQLTAVGIKCVVLAPTTMLTQSLFVKVGDFERFAKGS